MEWKPICDAPLDKPVDLWVERGSDRRGRRIPHMRYVSGGPNEDNNWQDVSDDVLLSDMGYRMDQVTHFLVISPPPGQEGQKP